MSDGTSSVRDRLIRKVEARWTERLATLLSQVGKEFGTELGAAAHGRKLMDVLGSDFADALRLVSRGDGNAKVWAVVPARVSEQDGAAAIPATLGGPAREPRIDRTIWAAFQAYLPPDTRRHVTMQASSYRFIDRPANEAAPQNTVFTLDPGDIAPQGTPAPEVLRRIEAVLGAKGVRMDDVKVGRHVPGERESHPATRQVEGSSLLDAVLDALTPAEQRRVTIPLDLVSKLLATRLK